MENFNENSTQEPSSQWQAPYQTGFPVQRPTLPNATPSLVLGILSIVTSCWFVGFILGIIGLVLGNKARTIYLMTPNAYSGYGMANAGRIMSIIGICIGGLYILYVLVIVGIIGVGVGLSQSFGWFQHLSAF